VGGKGIATYIINFLAMCKGEGSASFTNHFPPFDEAVWACRQVSWVGSRVALDTLQKRKIVGNWVM